LCQRRSPINPPISATRATENKFRLTMDPAWLTRNPLTSAALLEEIGEWGKIGVEVKVSGLEAAGGADEVAG